MRQYSRGLRNIATNLQGLATALAVVCGAVSAQDDVPDHQWYHEMAASAVQQQVLPPVEVSSFEIHGRAATADLKVHHWFSGHSLDFVLVLPAEEITSASLEADLSSHDPATVSGNAAASEIPISIRHLGYVRGYRLAKVQTTANLPGLPGQRLQHGRLTVAFESDIALPAAATATGEADFFKKMLTKLVANPADLDRLALPLEAVPSPAEQAPVPIGGYPDAVALFDVAEDGFVQFTGTALEAAGIDVSAVRPDHISVWSNGEQQAVLSSTSAGDDYIRPDDWFRLYATDNDSTYSTTRTYWIRTADEPALPMPVQAEIVAGPDTVDPGAHFQASLTVEEDNPPVLTKNDQFLTILGYRWVWWTWTPASMPADALPQPRDYDTPGTLIFDLPGLADTETTSAELELHFYAHRWDVATVTVPFRLELNDNTSHTVDVSEPVGLVHKINVPVAALRPTGNKLAIIPEVASPPDDLPEVCFDRLEIRYPRTYQMTSNTLRFTPPTPAGGDIALKLSDLNATSVMVADMSGDMPALVAGKAGAANDTWYFHTKGPASRPYLAVTPDAIRPVELHPAIHQENLLSPENQADLIVIASPGFIDDLRPWLDNKLAKGHAVKVVNIFDIYDQFGYGHQSPHAIRAFLHHASMHWKGSAKGPAASAVVLVGDSTSAYRNEFRNEVINYVPTMRLKPNDDPFASDQWYVTLFGHDAFPDALVGRFSVNNREDLRSVLKKQLDYEHGSAPGAWQNTLGFVADHSEFEDSIDRIMKQVVPPRFFLDRIMMSELPWVDNYYFPKEIADAREAKVSPEATGRIRDMFNKGAAVVTYFGHGSPNIWSNERMWFGGDSPNSDNLLLTNRDKLAIVINMTCNSGAIDYPQPRWNVAISEDFMRVENGGAVACFVPSGPGLTVQHERLMMEVGLLLFDGETEPLGQSFQLALWRYLAGGNPPDLALMYIFLGDPLLMPHISTPVDGSEAGSRRTNWAGTVALPPDMAGSPDGGNYQFIDYGETVQPGSIGGFTSATVALPLPAAPADAARVVALSASDDAMTTTVESTFEVVAGLPALQLSQWRRTDAAANDSTATLLFQLKNSTPVPLRNVRVQLQHDATGQVLAESSSTIVQGFEEVPVTIDVHTPPGFLPLQAAVVQDEEQYPLDPVTPIAVAGLRPDDMRTSIPPALVDPRSLSVRYRRADIELAATISLQLHVLAREPLSNLRLGLEDSTGRVIQDSVVTVPAVIPGENVRVSLSTNLPPEAPSQAYSIRFDSSGYFPEFERFPAETVLLGQPHLADLSIGAILPSDTSPTDGQTVFFDVEVGNAGDAMADGVKVEGLLVTTSTEPVALESQVNLPEPLLTLEPGTTQTVRLRWDPFRNAGLNRVRFATRSIYEMPDRNPDNNSRELSLKVNSKARLRRVKVGVLPLTPEDLQARQVRFMARVKNEGESAAHGLRVRFYSSAAMTEEEFLGEVDLERINPAETREVTFTYKLKPGEEDRPFNISFEVVYKGSRQRVPMD